MQQHINIRGLVIREVDFGDQDRYITVLTDSGVKIEVLCRGIRRKGARLAAAVRLFCYAELTLYEGRGKYTLNDAALLSSFWDVTQDIEAYALCCYFAELASLMSDSDEPLPAVTRLMLYALRALCDKKRPLPLVKAAFELRLLAEAGFAPQLEACGACGGEPAPPMFSIQEGTAVCAACARRLGGAWTALSGGTFAAMRHILASGLPKVFSFSLGEPSAQQLGTLCEGYTLYHTERGFASLDFYHSLFQPAVVVPKREKGNGGGEGRTDGQNR